MRANVCVAFSTGHYTEQDQKLLEGWMEDPHQPMSVTDCPMRVVGHDYGFFLQVFVDPERHLRSLEKLQQAGASADLIHLIQLAHDQGARWIEADTDAVETDGLPWHDW